MLKDFKTYQLSIKFHQTCESLKLPGYLKSQLLRASSSIALNLAEGSAKPTPKDQRRFYFIALGSLRETQAVLDLSRNQRPEAVAIANQLGAAIYRLCHPKI